MTKTDSFVVPRMDDCIDNIGQAKYTTKFDLLKGWLVGCFGFNGPLRQYFSLCRAVSQREGERGEKG